jgi:hypothetical protein
MLSGRRGLAMLQWLLFCLGVGMLVAWVVIAVDLNRIALTELVRVGAAIQVLALALWYGLLSTFAIVAGLAAPGLGGALLVGFGIWVAVMFCLKPVMGLLGTARPPVEPFYGEDEAVEATEAELKEKGIIK